MTAGRVVSPDLVPSREKTETRGRAAIVLGDDERDGDDYLLPAILRSGPVRVAIAIEELDGDGGNDVVGVVWAFVLCWTVPEFTGYRIT